MTLELVSADWETLLHDGLREDDSSLLIVCPFIKHNVVRRLLDVARPRRIEVITRFDLDAFADGVSDVAALRLLLRRGARVRGVVGLHAKLYLLGSRHALVTSANLTTAGLRSNHELGFSVREPQLVSRCQAYFASLWEQAGADLRPEQLADWDTRITAALLSETRVLARDDLGDDGTLVAPQPGLGRHEGWVANAEQAFVKFFGEGHRRAERRMFALDELERSGSHWACTYPAGKRPRSVVDGATMFLGRLVHSPNDILVFGRATAVAYRGEQDDATAADIVKRAWKRRWPHYVRVHDGEYVRGPLEHGVSLGALMAFLGPRAFASTLHNQTVGNGKNINPRMAYRRQPHVRLAPEGQAWLNQQLDAALAEHGRLSRADLSRLDPPPPVD